jgi:hypothetical protein
VPHVFHDDRIEIRFDLPDSLDIGPIMERMFTRPV